MQIIRSNGRKIIYAGPLLLMAAAIEQRDAFQAENARLRAERDVLRENLQAERAAYREYYDAVQRRRSAEQAVVDAALAKAAWAWADDERPRWLH